jgi:pyruvate dehydrogenase E2 component (dihydrolipoamide acetyltransferase)
VAAAAAPALPGGRRCRADTPPVAAAAAAAAAAARSQRWRPVAHARQPVGASAGARTRRRSQQGDASGAEGPHPQGGRHRLRQGRPERPGAGRRAAAASLGGGLDLLPWPKVDFAKFGAVEVKPLARIKKISAQNLARNWVMIPAVTYHEDADITDLEAFRVAINRENEKSGLKITMLAFLIKACAVALKKFPEFNSSLDGDNLVLKQYCHIAFAADTPNGLVVPVIKNADQKSVAELASRKRRTGEEGARRQTHAGRDVRCLFHHLQRRRHRRHDFSPIINAPEVAILGVNKSVMKPVWNGREFAPRLILPMSLTADHRVIDGALATRFNVYLAQLLADMRRVLL